MQGKPKSITISQDGGRWYCSVLCEYDIKEQEKKTDNIVGIDVGLKEFATLSDETVKRMFGRLNRSHEACLVERHNKYLLYLIIVYKQIFYLF